MRSANSKLLSKRHNIATRALAAWVFGLCCLLASGTWAQKPTKPADRTKALRTAKPKAAPVAAPSTAPPSSPIGDITPLEGKKRDKTMKKVKIAYKKFRLAALQYLGEVRALVQKRYRERRKLIAGGYDSKIDALEKREDLKRKKAIQYFLAFVNRYPNHQTYTPDAMYRLAELYYEEEYTQYLARAKKYDQDLQRFDNKEITDEPIAAKKQFTNTNTWLLRLTQRFPRYRYTGNAYYLLGYCKGEEGKDQAAIKYFALIPTLTNPRPTKKLIAEAYVRLGEFYFRTNKRDLAKAAYLKVLNFPKLSIYDKALYKLAWTHYLSDEFDLAVKRFTRLLDFYLQKKKGKTGDLRKEAIQYIAISFADEQWGTLAKLDAYVQRIGPKKPYVRDVLIQLASFYQTQNKWDQVIAVNNKIIQMYPNHPDTPLVWERNIQVFRQRGNPQQAVILRRQISKKFGRNSRWHKANATNIRAQRQVRNILSKSVYRTAIFHHTACNLLRKRAGEEKDEEKSKKFKASATSNCLIAAENYREFLRKFPHHKQAYELTWYLADSLYFAGRYTQAIPYFKKIRDWPGGGKYRMDASFSLVDSYVQQVNTRCRAKQIKRACELPESKQKEKTSTKKPKKKGKKSMRRRKIPKLPIPPLQKDLLAAREYYLKATKPDDKKIPEQYYLAARIYYAYDHLDEARRRLWTFIKRWPRNEYAQFAGNTIMSSYFREGNLSKVGDTIDKLKRLGINIKDASKLKTGLAFIEAKRLEEKGKYALAAAAYVKIIDKNPNHKEAAPALWNAALLYSKVQRYGSALALYERIVNRYSSWKLADQALFRLADNAEKYFQFKKAIRFYLKLVDDGKFRSSKHRADALYNAALLHENLQNYGQAAAAYRRYSILFRDKDAKAAAKSLYQAALVYKRAKRSSDMIRILREFIKRYKNDNDHVRLVMMAYGEIMDSYEKQGRDFRFMKREYQKVIDAYTRLNPNMQPVDITLTKKYPAKARYKIVLEEYKKFLALPVSSTNAKKQGKQILKKIKEYDRVATELGTVVQYGSAPWLLCTLTRIAEGKMRISESIQKAPIPKIRGLKMTQDLIDQYKDGIDRKFIQPLENDALKKYRKVVSESRRLHYENKCTTSAYEALNKADPRVPLPKKDIPKLKFTPLAPLPLITTLKAKPKPAPRKAPDKRAAPRPAPRGGK